MTFAAFTPKRCLTARMLRELLDYDRDTGIFVWKRRNIDLFKTESSWKTWNTRFSGTVAGRVDRYGYQEIRVLGARYKSHRLAWLYHYGEWPSLEIDHINRIKNDNRIENLREVSHLHNLQNQKEAQKNNKSTGILGVSFHKASEKFVANISLNGSRKYIGLFLTKQEAHKAYVKTKTDLHTGYAP